MVSRRHVLQAAGALGAYPLLRARAQNPGAVVRIGVLTDLGGPYKDSSGPVSIACTQMAAAEAMAAAPGLKVEVLQGDHQNKPDLALQIARRWFDNEGVDVVSNCNNSAIALAIATLARERDKVALITGAATADLTGPACSPNTVHWSYDTWEIAHTTGTATVKDGGKKWFFVAADYAFGHAMQADLTRWVTESGGTVVGTTFYPFPSTTDFSSFLLQASASGADVVALLNAGADFINCVKQAHEFGLAPPKVRLAGTATFITDMHSLGLEVAQGLTYTDNFYWDMNDRTRAFSARLLPRAPGVRAGQNQASDYAASLHYLKAVHAIGPAAAKASGRAAVDAMKAMPSDDDAFGSGQVRVDGRHLHPALLLRAKTPAESRGEWDLLHVVAVIPTDQSFRPLSEGKCPLAPA